MPLTVRERPLRHVAFRDATGSPPRRRATSFAASHPEKVTPEGGCAFITRSVWSVLGSAKSIVMPPATWRAFGLVTPEPQPEAS